MTSQTATRRVIPPLVATALVVAGTLLPRVAGAQVDFDEQEIYLARPTVVVTQARCVACRSPLASTFRVNLEAGLGYAGFAGPLFQDRAHGPTVNGAVVFSWGRGTQVGLRLAGFYGELSGVSEPFIWGDEHAISPRLFGGYAAVQASFRNGFWIAKGFGVTHVQTRPSLTTPSEYSSKHEDIYNLPELILALGYNLHLGRHVALQVSGEVGTLFASVRASVQVGGVLRF